MSLQESNSGSPSISPAPGSGLVCPAQNAAIPDAVRPVPGANPGSGIGDDWFYDVAVTVFGKKETGALLHNATGWPRTSCYAFVARDPEQRRRPSPEFLRILFHSPHGQPFHDAFMAGCIAPWWRARERETQVASVAERFKSELQRIP